MRISILLIKNSGTNLGILILVLCTIFPLKSQWVNNPAINTRLVIDGVKPINISSVEDIKGGAFIFWEDNKSGFQNEIFFVHMDGNGKVNFHPEGKKISDLTGDKFTPVVSQNLPNTAIVVWKDYSKSKNGNLFAQHVYSNGNLLWPSQGVQVTPDYPEVIDYSVCSDRKGNVYISYVARTDEFGSNFKLVLQKVKVNGQIKDNIEGTLVIDSPGRKTASNVIADNDGGAYLMWLENQNNKLVLFAQHIDSVGKPLWGKKGILLSNNNQSVMSYSVQNSDFSALYLAWQVQKTEKEIYHQLLSLNGKPLWGQGGKLATNKKGNNTNPQVLTADSTIILSWTNEFNKNKDIYIQKFNTKGMHKWKDDIAVVQLPRDQFGQKLLSDGKGGAIVSWIDKRLESVRPDIYAQRISSAGKQLWGPVGIAVASHNNSDKSYPSIISDLRGGAIAIFKDIRESKGEIYAQKIFNTGTYISQIIGLNAVLHSDTVKISWYSANESSGTNYDIERTVQTENGTSQWIVVGNIKPDAISSAKYYEFPDHPNEPGTLYYRVVQKDNLGNIQPSDVAIVEFFKSRDRISIGQNSPDPFSNETTILFYLKEPTWIKFEFFNSHIEMIKEIERQQYPQGENKITFSGKDLPAGVYFYRVMAEDFVEVRKMVLSR
jgi:hypothetical protein